MKDARTGSLIVMAYALLVLFPSSAIATDDRNITRDDLIKHLTQRMSLSVRGIPGLKKDEQQTFLEKVRGELRAIGNQVLPESLSASTQGVLKRILATNKIIAEADMTYNRLVMEEWIRGIKLKFAIDRIVEPLSAEEDRVMRESVRSMSAGMLRSMTKHLSEFFSQNEIANHVQTREDFFLGQIGDPFSGIFRTAVGADGVAAIVDEFDRRLGESVVRIRKRLQQAERVGLSITEDGRKRKEFIEREKAMILREISVKAYKVLAKRTADTELPKKIDLDSLDPKYRAVVRKRRELEKVLREQRSRRQENAAQQERDERARKEWLQVASQVIDPKIAAWDFEDPETGTSTSGQREPSPPRDGTAAEHSTPSASELDSRTDSGSAGFWVVCGLIVLAASVIAGVVCWRRRKRRYDAPRGT